MKRTIASILIVFFALATISIPRSVSQEHELFEPGRLAGLLGYFFGAVVFPIAGLFFSVRWRLTLSGRMHKTSTQSWLYILRPYAILAIVVTVVALRIPPKASLFTLIGVPMIAFWIWTIYASTLWLRYAHALDTAGPTEVKFLAKGPINPAPYILVALVLLFFWIAGNAYYSALPSVRLGRADEELKAIPLYRAISEADPPTYRRILTVTVRGMEKGEGVDAVVTRISPILSGTLSKYTPQCIR